MKIFQDFPFLRRVIGDHGGPIKKVRPITSRMKGFLDAQDVDAYLVMDTEGWRREMVPLTIDEIDSQWSSLTLRFDGFRHCDDYRPIGLALFVRGLNAWIINPFLGSSIPECITTEHTLKAKYTLDRVGNYEEYLPYEDLEEEGK